MWYFSYGSDLSWHAVADWCRDSARPLPRRTKICPAVLSNHRLAFNHYDPFWKCGVADAVPETGKSVGGALLEISAHGLETLERMNVRFTDRHGREAGERRLQSVRVTPYAGGPPIEAMTFRLIRPECHHIPPTRRYMQRLIQAACESGLSMMWVMQLNSFPVRDPAAAYVPPRRPSKMLAEAPSRPPHRAPAPVLRSTAREHLLVGV